jgi:hypothetical protein
MKTAQNPSAKRIRDPEQTRRWRKRYLRSNRQFSVTISAENYAALLSAAESAGFGKKPGQFLLALFRAHLQESYLLPKGFQEQMEARLGDLLIQVRGACTNLNQLARNANRLKLTTIFDLAEAKKGIIEIEKAIRKFETQLLSPSKTTKP